MLNLAMSKDIWPGADRQVPEAQRPSTPTSNTLTRTGFGDTTSMQEHSEQQLEAYAASFSSLTRQRLIHKLKDYRNPTWLGRDVDLSSSRSRSSLKSNTLSYKGELFSSRRLVENIQPANLLPAINLDRSDISIDLDQEIDETFIDDAPSAETFTTDSYTDDQLRSDKFPLAFHEDLDRIKSTDIYHFNASHSSSWYKPLPSSPPQRETASPSIDIPNPVRTPVRPRAPSLHSFSSSFVLKPPTSPLAQQSNGDELDFSPVDLDTSPVKPNRRHTLPPHGFQALRSDVHPMTMAQAARQPPSLQRERTFPFKTHTARRSYTGLPFPSSPSPSTPNFLRSRRSSFASDASPVQASMVGSYEESILRGRMSAAPSKPLDFVARIGALGRGDCKPKYPAHVSIGFPAVYYSWNASNGGPMTDEPSPYVGHIDLEHRLNTPATKDKARKRRDTNLEEEDLKESSVKSREARRKEKRRRRSRSPQGSLQSFGGCYRIPQQGQLQILISNPHKTAVKLFLVPYDLQGMQPGTKTFIRQRSCSAGPIIEKPLTSRSLSDSVVETRSNTRSSKPVLRYLIQLNICCSAKDRYYLYKSIHVVFANRVPDDKEKLQVETLWPEPRYSPWRASSSTESTGSTPSSNTADFLSLSTVAATKHPPISTHFNTTNPLLHPIDDDLPSYPQKTTLNNKHLELFQISRSASPKDAEDHQQTKLAFRGISPDVYTKLNRGESGYGGRPATPQEPGEGLLARRLRGLESSDADDQNSMVD